MLLVQIEHLLQFTYLRWIYICKSYFTFENVRLNYIIYQKHFCWWIIIIIIISPFFLFRYLDNKSLLLAPDFSVSAPAISQSTHLKEIVFVSPLKPTYAFLTHTIHYIPETQAHRNIRLRRHSARSDGMKSPVSAKRLALSKTPLSPTKVLTTLVLIWKSIPFQSQTIGIWFTSNNLLIAISTRRSSDSLLLCWMM